MGSWRWFMWNFHPKWDRTIKSWGLMMKPEGIRWHVPVLRAGKQPVSSGGQVSVLVSFGPLYIGDPYVVCPTIGCRKSNDASWFSQLNGHLTFAVYNIFQISDAIISGIVCHLTYCDWHSIHGWFVIFLNDTLGETCKKIWKATSFSLGPWSTHG